MESESKNLDPVIWALGVVRRRAPILGLCLLLTTLAAFAVSRSERKQYTATAQILFRTSQQDQQAAGLPVVFSGNPQPETDTNLGLATLPSVAEATSAAIGHGLTATKVRASVSVAQIGDTQLVAVSAISPSPPLAATIATTYSRQVIAAKQHADQNYYGNALRVVNLEFKALTPGQRAGVQGASLKDRIASLQVLSQLQSSATQLAEPASVPRSPSSPKVLRNTLLGAVIGLLLGLAFAFLRERFDRRLREPSDLEGVYETPLIGVVPDTSALSSMRIAKSSDRTYATSNRDDEVFALLRAHIRYFNVDRELRVVLIVSAAPGDGKTTIASNLALAAARAGSRVLLLDADLRRSSIAFKLRLNSVPGVTEVLVGSVTLEDAIQHVEPGDHEPSGRALDVLVAGGGFAPNAAQVLESRAMEALLGQTRGAYDLVVVDTSPMSVVSDAFPLLRLADGVVVVSRLGRNRRDVAARLRATLTSAEAPVIGVVANGSRQHRGSSYGYQYGYSYPFSERGEDIASKAESNGASAGSANGSSSAQSPAAEEPDLSVKG